MKARPDKIKALEAVIVELRREHETLMRASLEAHAAATHAEAKQENKYDTRGLEAGYLAIGQSKRATEIAECLHRLQQFHRDGFKDSESVAAGSLLLLRRGEDSPNWYFLLPGVGGIKVMVEDSPIQVVSTLSPLAAELIGKESGESFQFQKQPCEILEIV